MSFSIFAITMTFEEYLVGKKIDSAAFKKAEEPRWSNFKVLFEQMHPNSFTMQKLNVINGIRRAYPLEAEKAEATPTAKPKKPVIRPKTK